MESQKREGESGIKNAEGIKTRKQYSVEVEWKDGCSKQSGQKCVLKSEQWQSRPERVKHRRSMAGGEGANGSSGCSSKLMHYQSFCFILRF